MLSRVTRSFAAQLFGLLVIFADRFLVVGILLRVWGPDIYAEWAVLLSAASLLSLGELGLNIYFGNVWQKAFADKDAERFRRMVSVALACSLALGCLLGSVALAMLLWLDLPGGLSISTLSRGDSIGVLLALGVATLSRVVRGAISQIYRGRQEFARGIVIDQIFVAGLVLMTVIAALMGATPVTLAIVYVACDFLLGWCPMIVDLSRRWPNLELRPRLPIRAELTQLFSQVRWLSILNVTSVAWVQVPVVLLGYLGATGSAVVSFLIVRTLANLSRQIATLLAQSTGVEIAAVHYARRHEDVTRHLKAVGRILSVLTAAVVVAVTLFGEPFVALWTGRAALFDQWIAAALFGAVLISAPALPLSTLGMYANRSGPLAFAGMVQIILGLPACAVLGNEYGALGVAIGLAIGEAIAQGVVLPVIVSRYAGLDYLSYLGDCALFGAIAAIWCFGIGLGVHLIFDPNWLVGFVASALLWGVVGVAPSIVAGLPASQRASIARWMWSQTKGSKAP